MIVAGVKHACATCIRGHRSSACTHADRPLFEIRRKGRPISQCPHCRDLRKIKSSHTKCACGDTAAESAPGNRCQCHAGQPCSCAGPVSVYQYVPTDDAAVKQPPNDLQPSSEEGIKEKTGIVATNGGLLHTFDAFTVKTQNSMPYPSPHAGRRSIASSSPTEPDAEMPACYESVLTQPLDGSQMTSQRPTPIRRASNTTSIQRVARPLPPREAYPSTRSIGINTDLMAWQWPAVTGVGQGKWRPLLNGLTPRDRASLLEALQMSVNTQQTTISCCSSKRGSHGQPTPTEEDTSLRVPSFSTFYGGAPVSDQAALVPILELVPSQPPADALRLDHYTEENEPLDPAFWEGLFDVPGCSLPGVACQCGDGCTCAGCQTHRDNGPYVAAAEMERMDFEHERPVREHPASCCDTRIQHEENAARLHAAATAAASAQH